MNPPVDRCRSLRGRHAAKFLPTFFYYPENRAFAVAYATACGKSDRDTVDAAEACREMKRESAQRNVIFGAIDRRGIRSAPLGIRQLRQRSDYDRLFKCDGIAYGSHASGLKIGRLGSLRKRLARQMGNGRLGGIDPAHLPERVGLRVLIWIKAILPQLVNGAFRRSVNNRFARSGQKFGMSSKGLCQQR